MKDTKYNSEIGGIFIESVFQQSYIKSLSEYIEIPNLSRDFDPNYATNGLLQKAANHIKNWVDNLKIKGIKTEIIKQNNLTPLLFIEIEGEIKQKTICFYGHYDKQPPMFGWDENKGPTKPIIQNNRLYGRGGADDGYSTYSSMLAIKAIQQQGVPLPRIIMITEGDEQSGGHIEQYLKILKDKIGDLNLIICLDSDTIDYNHLCFTTSLRGVIGGELNIKVISEGLHSGDSSGIVPSCFKIANIILNRLENPENGKIHQRFTVDIPPHRYEQLYQLSKQIGAKYFTENPLLQNIGLSSNNPLQLYINNTWRPQLTVTGLSDLPLVENSGNVMIPSLKLKLSLRIPPNLDSQAAAQFLRELLVSNPPFGAQISFENIDSTNGFNNRPYSNQLLQTLKRVAQNCFQKELILKGYGGSIPMMNLMAELWPKAQILITGVLGPYSNAHGPNQFLDISYVKKLTNAIAQIVAKTSETY